MLRSFCQGLCQSKPNLTNKTIEEIISYTSKQNRQYSRMYFPEIEPVESQYVNRLLLSSIFSRIIGNNFPRSIYLSQTISVKREVRLAENVRGVVHVRKDLGKHKYELQTRGFVKDDLVIDGIAVILQE